MNLKSKLIKSLEAIAAELEESGKNDTASFFLMTRDSIETDCDGDELELVDLLRQLKSSGAIAQYANFSATEEQLWDDVYESASQWLDSFERLAGQSRQHPTNLNSAP